MTTKNSGLSVTNTAGDVGSFNWCHSDVTLKEFSVLCSPLGEMLAPICEASEHAEKLKDHDLSEQSTISSNFSSGDPRSLSETFTSLNRDFSCFNSQNKPHRTLPEIAKYSRRKNQVNGRSVSVSEAFIRKDGSDNASPKSFEKYLLELAIDFLPCLIAIIWAAAIFLSMPHQTR